MARSSGLSHVNQDSLVMHQSEQVLDCLSPALDPAQPLQMRQKVYVPTYTQIRKNEQLWTVSLTVTLSVRNTDFDHPIILNSVCEYGSSGALRKTYIREPLEIGALASEHFTVEEIKHQGETGASFIIDWQSDEQVNQPIIEAIMINGDSQNNLAFISPGRVIDEHRAPRDSGTELKTP